MIYKKQQQSKELNQDDNSFSMSFSSDYALIMFCHIKFPLFEIISLKRVSSLACRCFHYVYI